MLYLPFQILIRHRSQPTLTCRLLPKSGEIAEQGRRAAGMEGVVKVELPCATIAEIEKTALLLDVAAASLKTILIRVQAGELAQDEAIGTAHRALMLLV